MSWHLKPATCFRLRGGYGGDDPYGYIVDYCGPTIGQNFALGCTGLAKLQVSEGRIVDI